MCYICIMDSINSVADPLEAAKSVIEETSVNLFLTGKAGTGKTTFLRNLSAGTAKRHVILAPTGVAAINAGGSTIHSFFQLSFAPFVPGRGFASGENERYNRFSRQKLKLIRTLDLIIIDEISMVRPDVLDAVDDVLRRLRNPRKPFGGVQLLLIGDLRQLAPVAQDGEWQYLKDHYSSTYFFESKALKEAGFLMLELTRIYRQNDPVFVDILNKIRDNTADAGTLARLNRRANVHLDPSEEDDYIRLTTHNYRADSINAGRLRMLPAPEVAFTAEVKGDFPESAYPADAVLRLKKGAKVMFIKNDLSGNHEYYNGMLGTVTDVSPEEVVVQPLERDLPVKVGRTIWERMRYTLGDDGEIKEEPEGIFMQIPLRLAWCITIHKSQGLTFDKAIVDACDSFAPGQTYVALSRCRSLDGLVLDSPLPPSAIKTDPAVNRFIGNHPRMEGSGEELEGFRQSYYAEMLAELFDFRIIAGELDNYYRASATVLGKDYPKFVDSVSNAVKNYLTEVTDVAGRLFSFFRSAVPRRSSTDVAERLTGKIRGGADYFAARLEALDVLVRSTPVNIDNKVLKKRLTTAARTLVELLDTKCSLLRAFAENEFDAGEYIRLKTRIILGGAEAKPHSEPKESRIAPEAKRRATAPAAKRQATAPAARRPVAQPPVEEDIRNPELYHRLAEWRIHRADGRPAYTVLANRTLMAISAMLPATPEELMKVPGIGRQKMQLYGGELVDIVKKYKQYKE